MDHTAALRILPLSGPRTGGEPGWTGRRRDAWLLTFLILGVAIRVLRFGLKFPLWRDEAFLAANLLDRDFAGLTRPLDYQQVCPLLFLWAEKAISEVIGFNEWSMRLLPTLASIASLLLFRHLAGRLLDGVALVIAVGIFAIAYFPILHGAEIKPYATDLLLAIGLLTPAVEWLRTPDRAGFLWGLAALAPPAIGASNPAIFCAASVGLVLTIPVLGTRSPRAIAPFLLFLSGSLATFWILHHRVNASQSASVMEWMRIYWAGAFPPRSPLPLLLWLVRAHTSQMFAYPAGGDVGASTLTTGMVVVAILAFVRRGNRWALALLLTPFALGLIAAFLGRYPYGGSARTMQYLAPSIIILAGLGAAVLLARLPRPDRRELATRTILCVFIATGLGMMAWDVAHPYKTPNDDASRDFARRFWSEESRRAGLLCAKTDLRLPLDPLVWRGDRAAIYLCYQAIYSHRPPASAARNPLAGDARPLGVVVFGEVPEDAATVADWSRQYANLIKFKTKRVRVLNENRFRGKAKAEDRYVIHEFAPVHPIPPHAYDLFRSTREFRRNPSW